MPVRQYLDNTVVPVLLQAMTEVAKVRYDAHYADLTTQLSLSLSTCSTIKKCRGEGEPRKTNDFIPPSLNLPPNIVVSTINQIMKKVIKDHEKGD